jgi:ABC-type transporter Mla subunit MlaD
VGRPGLAELTDEARGLVTAARHIYAALGGEPGLGELRAMVRDAREVIGELRAAIDRLVPRAAALAGDAARIRDHLAASAPIDRAQAVLATARAALAKLEPMLASLDQIGDRLARGEGSLGRLMTDPEFSDDAKDLGKIIKRHPWRVMERPAK